MHLFPFARALLGSVAFLLAAGQAVAQSTCPPPAPTLETLKPEQVRADVRDRGFLWELTRDGRKSWLYGTVHVSRPEWLLPGRRVQAALQESEVLALELDPGDPELVRIFTAPGDAAREARVMAGLQPRLAKVAERECLPVAKLAAMRPILQVTTLGLQQSRRDGFHPELAVDAVLWGFMQRMGKPVVALETPAAQLEALTPATEADERVLVTRSLEEIESGADRRSMRRLLQAWADSDLPALASYEQWCECMETPQEQRYLRRINDERNGPIADRLLALHGSGKRFFAAVGALHMTGPQALPGLLRARGFEVRPVPPSRGNAP
ncbi:TraB/GumN family protein [Ramlibacter sp. USB13]|uniref:TraB/GumN family protein n=1 Tax=Ramlibacter cellulosilyticus TaxID=2764187 RepID=A0A923SAK0_9BURK|nr:TraB/GumN family protein [Ramlibacter cellulosilyticus]MBC5782875.1 TraB/GumN family protein [Ramlibacter cellulosilyticus]